MKQLIQFLLTLGKITKPKCKDPKGITIYNPGYFAENELRSLCEPLGFDFINTKEATEFEDPKTGKITKVDPHVFVGLTNSNAMNADETESYLSDLA